MLALLYSLSQGQALPKNKPPKFFFFKQTFNNQANLMANANVMSGCEELAFVVFDFHRGLTGDGMPYNVGRCFSTLLKILNAFWILAVDSDQHSTQLKLQSYLTCMIAGVGVFFSVMCKNLMSTDNFYVNATRAN
jgi:hypothetical protein